MEALTACHTMEFKLHPMGREANEVLREGLLRQTGTWDPLLQCFHLDKCSLKGPAHTFLLRQGAKVLLLVFAPSCCRQDNKALPEFLLWPLINFY